MDDDPPSGFTRFPLLIELLSNLQGIWIELYDHMQGRVDLQYAFYVCLVLRLVHRQTLLLINVEVF